MPVGRKRKSTVAREGNGRQQRGERPSAPTEVRRLRDAALCGMRDPEWGSELGRLYLQQQITAEMYAAGKKWCEDAAEWRGSIGIFPIKSTSIDSRRSCPPDPDSERGQYQVRRDQDAAERFFEAHSVLVLFSAEAIVSKVCEDNQSLAGFAELQAFRRGLQKLADHYGLAYRPRRAEHVTASVAYA